MKPLLIATITFGLMVSLANAQAPFEAASIKLNPDCNRRPRSNQPPSPGRLTLVCTTLNTAIQNAYGIWANGVSPNPVLVEVSGGPSWINSDFYEIFATAGDNMTLAQIQGPMLQGLLEERFKLKLHRTAKEGPVYSLTVVKGGHKLKSTPDGSCDPNACGRPVPGANGRNVTLDGHGVNIREFAEGLLSRSRAMRASRRNSGSKSLRGHFTAGKGTVAPMPRRKDPMSVGWS